jgi:hypothetical protein
MKASDGFVVHVHPSRHLAFAAVAIFIVVVIISVGLAIRGISPGALQFLVNILEWI